MPKYLSGRSKRTSNDKLPSDRYKYLSIEGAEPNPSDPKTVGISEGSSGPVIPGTSIPGGRKYQVFSVWGDPNPTAKYWQPIEGGLIPGSVTFYKTNSQISGSSSITQLDWYGIGVTFNPELNGSGSTDIRAKIFLAPPGKVGELVFNETNPDYFGSGLARTDFSTSSDLTFNSTTGILTVGSGIHIGNSIVGFGSIFNAIGVGNSAKVGVGTTNPTQNLHVVGNLRLTGTLYDGDNKGGNQGDLIIKAADDTLEWKAPNQVQSGAGGTISEIQYHDDTGFVEGAPNFVWIETTQRVGIGSTQPVVLLDVLGNSIFTGINTFVGLTSVIDGGFFADDVYVSGVSTFIDDISIGVGATVGFGTTAYFRDDAAIYFGDGNDLVIYHDSSNNYSYIKEKGSGNLVIQGSNITIENKGGTKNYATFTDGGNASLYHNNILRIETLDTGAKVTGILTATQTLAAPELHITPNTGIATIGLIKLTSNKIDSLSGNLLLEAQGNYVQVNDRLFVNDTTESTFVDDGALQVNGGVGINKNLNVGGGVSITGSSVGVAVTLAAAGGITTTGGDLFVGVDLHVAGDLYLDDDIFLDEGHFQTLIVNPGVSTFHGGINAKSTIHAETKIGIGSEIPRAKLDVKSAGATAIFNSGSASEGRLEFEYNDARVGLLAYHSDRLEIQTDSSKDFTIRTGGTNERLRIDSTNGQVCIGDGFQSTGGGQLTIRGVGVNNYSVVDQQYVGTPSDVDMTLAQIRFTANTSGTNVIEGAKIEAKSEAAWTATGDAPTRLEFWTAPDGSATLQERLRITSGGQISINNISPKEWDTSYTSLQIHDAGYIAGSTDDSFVAIGANNYLDGTDDEYKYINADFASQLYQVDGELIFRNAVSGTADNAITWTERLRIDSSGNVGIGTDNPITLLQVGAATTGRLNFDSVNGKLTVTGVQGGAARIDLVADQGDDAADTWRIASTTGNDLKIQRSTSHTDILVIKQSGKIGINTDKISEYGKQVIINGALGLTGDSNTTNPDSPNDVGMNFFRSQSDTEGYIGIGSYALSHGEPDDFSFVGKGNLLFGNHDGSWKERLRITQSGDVGIGTTNPTASNINSILSDINSVLAVGVVTAHNLYASGTFFGNVEGGITVTDDITIPDWITHKDDTNTKFGFPNNDIFAVETNNKRRLTINSSGYVGIATDTPNATLDVRTPNTSDSTGIANTIFKLSDSSFQVNQAHNNWTTADYSPMPILRYGWKGLDNGYPNGAGDYMYMASGGNTTVADQMAIMVSDSHGFKVGRSGYDGVEAGISATAEYFRITKDGGVGIGTNNPYVNASFTSLSVGGRYSKAGLLELNRQDGTAGAWIDVWGDTISEDPLVGSGDLRITTAGTAHNIQFWPGGTFKEKITFTSDGDVGIGTTNPTHINALEDNTTTTLAVGIVTANKVYGANIYGPLNPDGDVDINGFLTVHKALSSTYSASTTEITPFLTVKNTSQTDQSYGGIRLQSKNDSVSAEAVFNIACVSSSTNYESNLVFQARTGDSSWAEKLRITSGGQISINHISPKEWNTAYRSLQIQNGGYIAGSTENTFVAIGANNYLDTEGKYKYTNTDFASQLYHDDGKLVFRNAVSGTEDTDITWSERLRITSDGSISGGGTVLQKSDLNWTTDTNQRAHIFSGNDDGITTPADGVVVAASPWINPVGQRIGAFAFGSKTSSTAGVTNSGLKASIEGHTNANPGDAWKAGSEMRFLTKPDNGDLAIRLVIDSSGHLIAGENGTQNIGSATTTWGDVHATKFYGSVEGDIIATGDISIPQWIKHTDDENTKFGFPSNDTFAINTDNSRRLTIDSNGKILTSGNTQLFGSYTEDGSDNKAIMINGGGDVSDTRGGYLLVHGNEHSSNPGVTRLNAGNVGTAGIEFYTAGKERVLIDSTGQVGIGTDDPGATLTVQSDSSNTNMAGHNYLASQSGIILQNRTSSSGHFTAYTGNVVSSGGYTQSGSLAFEATNSGTTPKIHITQRTGSGVQSKRITIATDGNVGIGTNDPSDLLDVYKYSSTAYDATSDSAQRNVSASITIRNDDGTNNSFSQLVFDTGGTDQSIARIVALRTGSATNDLAFVTEHSNTAAERLRITSAGHVGIGTNDPVGVNSTTNNVATLAAGTIVADKYWGTFYGVIDDSSTGTIENAKNIRITEDEGGSGTNYLWFGDSNSEGGYDGLRIDKNALVYADGKLLIGHSATVGSGVSKLQVSTNAKEGIDINGYSTTAADGGRLTFYRSKASSVGTNTLVEKDDSLGRIDFRGFNSYAGTDGVWELGAVIEAVVDDVVNESGDMASSLIFKTTSNDTETPTERLRIDSSGNLDIPFVDNGTGLRQKIRFVTEASHFDEVAYISADRTAVSNAPTDLVFGTGAISGGSVNTQERLRISSDGNVGIGTNDPVGVNSTTNNVATLAAGTIVADKYWGTFYGDIDSGSTGTIENAKNILITDDTTGSGTHYIHFGSETSSYDGVEVDSAGLAYKDANLGVGDNNPDTRLSVNSGTTDVVAKFTSTDDKAWIQFRDNSTTDTSVMVGAKGNDLLLRAGENTRVRIKSNGALCLPDDDDDADGHGKSGQVLTSNGDDAPTWQDATGGDETGGLWEVGQWQGVPTVGINTVTSVGIGTINPTGINALENNDKTLAVGILTANTVYAKNLNFSSGDTSPTESIFTKTGTITSGVTIIDEEVDDTVKFVEYTVHFTGQGGILNHIQASKILTMPSSGSAYTQEYAIMMSHSRLADLTVDIGSHKIRLKADVTTGTLTYVFTRKVVTV